MATQDELRQRTRFEPATVEPRLFAEWEQATGDFDADPRGDGDTFVIALPPPNITGELHMGHALNGTIQDTMMRRQRMAGRRPLWICGTDHSGIAVHSVIEKQLKAEGTNRHELGRERFLERVWKWRAETGATIIQQFKRLGCSLDYGHERFTMDEGYVRAVTEMFVRLYHKDLIYRDNRIVNWCPGCGSTVSDLEVRYEHAVDTLYEVRYEIAGTNDHITVATVRPETILADTAVAVHPDDERYTHLIGRTAIVPLVEREVPIIADSYVKPDFGSGALKITPGHDPNDFEIGRRHGLAEITVIGTDGRMNSNAGEFAGMAPAEARQKVVDALFAAGLLKGEEPLQHEVGHCDRSGDRIEPLILLQWFMQMEGLAAPSNEAVRSGRVRFTPKNQEHIYFDWMENIRPWCVSRQLWWGHQIPVWYCPDGHRTVTVDAPSACVECGSTDLERDPDVLDTWFSSALWPFATLGWPEPTDRLEAFYPGHVLVTARDIINLWVARMLMMGIEFMGEIPFSDVYITSIIQAPDGRRMSKSLGTGINPLDLIQSHGADATRYGLLKMSSTQDVRFAEGMIEEGGKLANKLWNASRFVLLSLEGAVEAAPGRSDPVDQWMLSRLATVTAEVERQLDRYEFAAAVKELYALIWNDFCDIYIEDAKLRQASGDVEVAGTLLHVLDRLLRLAHPVLPFVTEEIWAFVPGAEGLLMLAPAPPIDHADADPAAEAAMDPELAFLSDVRRSAADAPGTVVTVPPGFALHRLVGRVRGIEVREGSRAELSAPEADPAVAAAELTRRLATIVSELKRSSSMLGNERFTSKAPPALVEAEREKVARFSAERDELERQLAELR
jgi:valyl-tRNA synthetase